MSKIGDLRERLFDLLLEHARDDALPTNARFLYYELLQRLILQKQHTGAGRSDQIVHDPLTDLRESGRMPWDWIVDETRRFEDDRMKRSKPKRCPTAFCSICCALRSKRCYPSHSKPFKNANRPSARSSATCWRRSDGQAHS